MGLICCSWTKRMGLSDPKGEDFHQFLHLNLIFSGLPIPNPVFHPSHQAPRALTHGVRSHSHWGVSPCMMTAWPWRFLVREAFQQGLNTKPKGWTPTLVFKSHIAGKEDVLCGDSIHGASKGSFTSLEPRLPNGRSSKRKPCQTAPPAPPPLGVHHSCFLWL